MVLLLYLADSYSLVLPGVCSALLGRRRDAPLGSEETAMSSFAAAALGSLVVAATVSLTAPAAHAGVTCTDNGDGTHTVTLTTKKGTTSTTYDGACRGKE